MSVNVILVSGGAGYVGSVTCHELVGRGEEIVVIDDLSTGFRDALPEKAEFIHGDIGDERLVSSVIAKFRVDSVIHFAAKSLVSESVRNPLSYIHANLTKTVTLLRVMEKQGVRSIVLSSSAAVYGEPETVPITENHAKHPINPYGLSKWWIEQTLQWCEHAWGLTWISLRYFNAAGGVPSLALYERHKPETHLIPLALAAWAKGVPVDVFGTDYPTRDHSAVRDFVHVSDLASAHVAALEATKQGRYGAYNVGTGQGHSVLEVLSAIESATGSSLARNYLPRRLGDPAVLVADNRKIVEDLSWKPKYSDMATIVSSAIEAVTSCKLRTGGDDRRGGLKG